MSRTICVTCGRGYGHVTGGRTLFEAVANAIRWWEVECRHFGTARRVRDDEIFEVMAMVDGEGKHYRVRVGDVGRWLREREAAAPLTDDDSAAEL